MIDRDPTVEELERFDDMLYGVMVWPWIKQTNATIDMAARRFYVDKFQLASWMAEHLPPSQLQYLRQDTRLKVAITNLSMSEPELLMERGPLYCAGELAASYKVSPGKLHDILLGIRERARPAKKLPLPGEEG